MELLERARDIVLRPKATWLVIRDEAVSVKDLTKSYAAILALVPALAELIGMVFIGHTFMGVRYRRTLAAGLAYGLVSYVVSLASVFVVTYIVNSLAPRFGSRKNFLQAFKLVTYSWTASWLAGLLGLVPFLSWLAAAGSFYSLYLLYVGLPLLMETPKEKVVVYFLLTIVLSIAVIAFIGATLGLILVQGGLP